MRFMGLAALLRNDKDHCNKWIQHARISDMTGMGLKVEQSLRLKTLSRYDVRS